MTLFPISYPYAIPYRDFKVFLYCCRYEPYYGALLFSDNSDEREMDQIKTVVGHNGGMHQEICDNLVILPEIEVMVEC